MIPVRKKSGFPEKATLTDPLNLQNYTILCKYLNETKKLAVTEHMLSQFTFNILQFMETYFGKSSTAVDIKKKMVKIPYAIFKDFRISGGLCTVFEVSARESSISKWLTTDLLHPSNVERGAKLLLSIEKALLENGLIRLPVFYFGDSVRLQPHGPQLTQELIDVAKSHGAVVTEDQGQATFVVLWDEEVDGTLDRELQEEYIRPLELRPNQDGGVALVHWWYHPDSYDEWIPSQDVQFTDTPDAEKYMQLYQKNGYYQASRQLSTPTFVCCRYLKDVADFNEWGNILDYEMDKPLDGLDTGVSSGTRKGRSKKRSIDRRQHTAQKQGGIQSIGHISQSVPTTEKMLQELSPPSVRDGNSNLHNLTPASVNVVNVTANQSCDIKQEKPVDVTRNSVPSDMVGALDGNVRKRARGDEVDDGHYKRNALGSVIQNTDHERTVKDKAVLNTATTIVDISQLHSSPHLPTWFDADSISTVEMKYIPDVILSCVVDNGYATKKNSEEGLAHDAQYALTQRSGQKYLSVRNFIVHLYHQKMNTFLTATECRRKIAGDVTYIVRIHEFLDSFGIINYSRDIKTVFRNPKSAIYYSSCVNTSNSASQQGDTDASIAAKGGESIWNAKLDKVLIKTVASMTESKKSLEENAHEVGGIDWHEVAKIVASAVEEQKQMQYTSVACLVRFTEMNLGHSGCGTLVPDRSGTLTSRSQEYVAGGSNVSKPVRALASLVTSSISKMDIDTSLIHQINEAIAPILKKAEVSTNEVATLSTGVTIVSSAAQQASMNKLCQAEGHLDDYISLRLSVLEKKVELVGDIEDALIVERERLELDHHDLQVQRAQHAASMVTDVGHIGGMF